MTDNLRSAADPLVVRPRAARRLLGDCSEATLWSLLNAGRLESYLDGRARYITMASIRRYIADKLAQPDSKVSTPRRRGRPPSKRAAVGATT